MAVAVNHGEYCPLHTAYKLLTVCDIEFFEYFGIDERKIFCCPLMRCDYVFPGSHSRIMSQSEFIQLVMFARQKAFEFKYNHYYGDDGK